VNVDRCRADTVVAGTAHVVGTDVVGVVVFLVAVDGSADGVPLQALTMRTDTKPTARYRWVPVLAEVAELVDLNVGRSYRVRVASDLKLRVRTRQARGQDHHVRYA
jgi:hypothetical protein